MSSKDTEFAVLLGALSIAGFILAAVGRTLFKLIAKITRHNVVVRKSDLELMTSPGFIRIMRIFLVLVSVGMSYEALTIFLGV